MKVHWKCVKQKWSKCEAKAKAAANANAKWKVKMKIKVKVKVKVKIVKLRQILDYHSRETHNECDIKRSRLISFHSQNFNSSEP